MKQSAWFYSTTFVLALLLSACSDPTLEHAQGIKKWAAQAKKVKIIRDDFGVPHIYGKTDADAVFGLLYAQAEDDFPRIERNYIWAMGRLAEVEGEAALYSDVRAKLYMTTEQAIAAYQSAPDWLKALCQAFADGLNYYLATHPDVTPKLITHFEPWMPMYFFEGSIGGDIEQIPLKGIEAFYKNQQNAPRILQPDTAEPSGSNGFAISGAKSASGNAMLLINPHTSFYFRGEVHVVSEEGLNAYGAVTWGQFFVYQGFNEHNGWMHTSTRADFIDEFVEDVFEENGQLYYTYGDQKRPVQGGSITLNYLDDGQIKQKTFPTYHTHHGPVTHMIDGKWVTTKINWDPVNALKQSYIRTKTKNHVEFEDMMAIRTNSSNNTVYADANGTIAYYHGNFMPKRDPSFDYSHPVDGSNPNTDWQGIHPLSETISIVNPKNGWIQNANSTPFSAAAEYSPKQEDYPPYMAPDSENFRGLHGIQVLTQQDNFTLDSLIDAAYDPYLPAMEALIPGLIAAYQTETELSPTTQQALEVLKHWNYQVSSDSVAMTLAHFYGMTFLTQGNAPTELSPMQRVRYFGKQSPLDERRAIFEQTLTQLNNDFGTWKMQWGNVNRLQRLSGEINAGFDDTQPSLPVGLASGRWGALAAYGARAFDNTKKLYGYRGNSFVAVVEFGEKVKAKTLLAGGQSGDPSSPHFFDQAKRYIEHNFKDVAFYRDDVEQRAVKIYSPGPSR